MPHAPPRDLNPAASHLHRFDMRAFHAALDIARQVKGLSWAELAVQTNRPFEGTTSIPIHPATLSDVLASIPRPALWCSRRSPGWGPDAGELPERPCALSRGTTP